MNYLLFSCLGFYVTYVFIATSFADQDGFLSLSCGGAVSFVDNLNISWVPDGPYVTNGISASVNFVEGSSSPLPLRFFPNYQKGRKCYRVPAGNIHTAVLVRAQFYYQNYDGLGSGYPVISSLEIRPLPQGAYGSGTGGFPPKCLRKSYRVNCGYGTGSVRYPIDSYDRIWDADKYFLPYRLTSGFNLQLPFNHLSDIKEIPPIDVLRSARVLARRNDLNYKFPLDKFGDYHIILHFAGILPVSPMFDILINGIVMRSSYIVKTGEASTVFFTQQGINNLNITFHNISYYPQVNAIEVYELVNIPPESSSTTVSALHVIQQTTGVELGWEDDPCFPTPWKHIGCEDDRVTSLDLSNLNLRSINPTFGDLLDLKTLDLHNTSLTGEIKNLASLQELENLNLSYNQLTSFGSDFTTLSSLQYLDMQNNNLEGNVPESLGHLKNLKYLNLENNKLGGTLPKSLNRKGLEVRTTGNVCLSFSSSTCTDLPGNKTVELPQVTLFSEPKTSGHHRNAIIIGTVVGLFCALLFVALLGFIYIRRKRATEVSYTGGTSDLRNWNSSRILTYKEIKTATKNFKEVIGRGSFGSVYIGKFPEGKLVAVKVRSDKSQLGQDSFINEVYLLSQIHHQNLVSLEGFCSEARQQILVYEYLPGGTLADNLYGSNSRKITLSWVRRLKIAVDAAKGLDYLHNGSNPRVIHRDVKCSNILLDSDMNAKVCDFGLSRQVPQADLTHVTTVVKGTAGYLDPEYYATQQLTEKSDVYSFGVVLLELICGREPLCHSGTPDSYNLVLWAKPYLQAGVFEIVDHSLTGNYEVESMRKTASIASRCVERDASQRPTIAEVLAELKEAYSIQLSFLASIGYAH
ncbi:hypothetical protein ACHQM5_027852 [Ranunculus cassubicifolius]